MEVFLWDILLKEMRTPEYNLKKIVKYIFFNLQEIKKANTKLDYLS